MSAALLDTCAAIWLAEDEPLSSDARSAIVSSALQDSLFVSPVSAWEIGLLCAAGRFLNAKTRETAQQWMDNLLARTGIHIAPLTPAIALASAYLPDLAHRDPADRFLLATARALNIPIVTRDRVMLRYAEAGHVQCIPC